MAPAHKAGITTIKAALAAKGQAAKTVAGPADKSYKFPEGWKAPKSLATAADSLYKAQQARFMIQKEVDKLQEEETALKQYLIANLPKGDASGIAGKLCRVSITKNDIPRAENWPEIYAGIVNAYGQHKKKKDGLEDGAFTLLQRRLGESAVKESWEAGLVINGIGKFTITGISISKI